MREVAATLAQKKAYFLVHEANHAHGGAPLDALKLELKNEQLRAQLFDGRPTIVWHRVAALQVCCQPIGKSLF